MERGQMYIFYALLFTIAYWLTQKKFKLSNEASGFVLGIAAWIRPTLFLMNVPLLMAGRWKMIAGNVAGLLTGLCISFLAGQKATWQSYFKAMSIWGKAQTEGMPMDLSLSNIQYPYLGEGIDLSLWGKDYDIEFFSIQALVKQYAGINLNSLILSIIFFSLLSLLAIYFRSIKNSGENALFIFGFLIVMLSEYFLPAPRASYNYVQWIFLILLIIKEIKPNQNLVILLLLTGLFLNIGFDWIPENKTLGEMAMWTGTFLLLHYITKVKKESGKEIDKV
jgi:hypothetical protein